MKFARWVLVIAGAIGMLSLFPMYFKERSLAPSLLYPEFYYSVISTKVLLQILYIHISNDPVRFRPVIFVGSLIKLSASLTLLSLIYFDRTITFWLYPAIVELIFAILFLISFFLLKKHEPRK